MNFRLTGILALAVLLLGVAIAFWDRDEDTARQRLEQARRAFRFDAARVDRLVLESDNVSLECVRRGRQWHLVRPLAARADPVAIERLLGALQELPRGDLLLPPRRAANDLAPYGFAPPRARIAIVEGTATNWIEIGRRTPLGDGIYVRQPAQAGMVRIPPDLLDRLKKKGHKLKADEVRFASLQYLKLGAVTRKQGAKDESLSVEIANYVLLSPEALNLDEANRDKLQKVANADPLALIEYWSVDPDYDGEVFRSVWQDYRGNTDNDDDPYRVVRTARLAGLPKKNGKRRICVRVVDVFGFEAEATVEVA